MIVLRSYGNGGSTGIVIVGIDLEWIWVLGVFLVVGYWYGTMLKWFDSIFFKEEEWRLSSFYCSVCGKKIRGLENLVDEERHRHECLKGLIVVCGDEELSEVYGRDEDTH